MSGRKDPATGEEQAGPRELVRLAIPRRVYSQSHIDDVVEVTAELYARLERLPGYRFVQQTPFLRHFSAGYAPLT